MTPTPAQNTPLKRARSALNHSPAVTGTAAATFRGAAIGTGQPSSAASVLHQGGEISPVTSTGTVTTLPAAVTLSANSHFPPPLNGS